MKDDDVWIFSDSVGVKIFIGDLTCHSRPRIRCGTPAAISSWRMLTILHPSARAEFNPKIRFSAFLKIFKFPPSFGCLFNTRSSTVPGFAQFIAEFLITILKIFSINIMKDLSSADFRLFPFLPFSYSETGSFLARFSDFSILKIFRITFTKNNTISKAWKKCFRLNIYWNRFFTVFVIRKIIVEPERKSSSLSQRIRVGGQIGLVIQMLNFDLVAFFIDYS